MWMGLTVLSFIFAISAHTQLSLGIQASLAEWNETEPPFSSCLTSPRYVSSSGSFSEDWHFTNKHPGPAERAPKSHLNQKHARIPTATSLCGKKGIKFNECRLNTNVLKPSFFVWCGQRCYQLSSTWEWPSPVEFLLWGRLSKLGLCGHGKSQTKECRWFWKRCIVNSISCLPAVT